MLPGTAEGVPLQAALASQEKPQAGLAAWVPQVERSAVAAPLKVALSAWVAQAVAAPQVG